MEELVEPHGKSKKKQKHHWRAIRMAALERSTCHCQFVKEKETA
jgi:hypothetical protein